MDDLISLSKSRFYIKFFFVFTGEIKISTNENGKAVFGRSSVSTHLEVLLLYTPLLAFVVISLCRNIMKVVKLSMK